MQSKRQFLKSIDSIHRFSIIIIPFLILMIFPPGNLRAADVYIDPTYDGMKLGTFNNPYKSWRDVTISASNDYRQKCGTSSTLGNPLKITTAGTSNNYIIIGAYNPDGSHEDGGNERFGSKCSGGLEKPILRRTSNGTGTTIATAEGGNQYLHINSIKLINAETAISVVSKYNRIRYCYFYNVEWGIRLGIASGSNDGDNNTIEYNYINLNDAVDEDNLSGDCVTFYSRAQNNTFQYNICDKFDHGGVFFDGGDINIVQYNHMLGTSGHEDFCIGNNRNSDSNIIRFNYCQDSGQGYQLMGGNGNDIYSNIFSCNGPKSPLANQGCVQVQSSSGTSYSSSNNKFYNNTIYEHNKTSGSGILLLSKAGDGYAVYGNKFYNNVILNVRTWCIRIADASGVINTTTFYNNSCYDYGPNQYAYIEGSSYSTASAFNARGDASNNRQDNPGLKNPPAGLFWPDSTGDNVVGNGYNLGAKYNKILDPDLTNLKASPPRAKTKSQPTNWYIGSHALPSQSSGIPAPSDLKISQ